MVCMGNICRSPMAHGLLEEKIKKYRLNWKVDSAGTSNYHEGEKPDTRAINCMKSHNIHIEQQHSRPFLKEDFELFDLIFCMDKINLREVRASANTESEAQKASLILHQIEDELEEEVPDPYYGGTKGFEKVYQLLDRATNAILTNYANIKTDV